MASTAKEAFVKLQVVEYCCTGDDTYYDSHSFSLRVWSEQEQLHYSIQRDYLAFCELHYRLTKKFVRTQFPDLILDGYKEYVKAVGGKPGLSGKLIKTFQRRGSSTESSKPEARDRETNDLDTSTVEDGRDAMVPPPKVKVVSSAAEMIPQRKNVLTEYLNSLLELPDVLASEEIKLFLDEEAIQGRYLVRRDVVDIDQALVGEEFTTSTVARDHSVDVTGGKPGDTVVWSFATKKKDIGFYIMAGDKVLMSYRRYDCHEGSVSGCLELVEAGTVSLVWDNSYSKLRSKQLTYVTKVVKKEEFHVYQRIAFEKGRDRHRYEQQRVTLGRALSASLASALTKAGVGPFRVDIKGTSSTISSMEQELVQLRENLLATQARATELDVTQKEAVVARQTMEVQLKEETRLREEAEARENLAITDLEDTKKRLEDVRRERDTMREQIMTHEQLVMEKDASLTTLGDQLQEAEGIIEDLSEQLTKQRNEKKQLKAFALKLKADDEDRLSVIDDLRQQVSSLGEIVSNSAAAAAETEAKLVIARAAVAAATAERDKLLTPLQKGSTKASPAAGTADGTEYNDAESESSREKETTGDGSPQQSMGTGWSIVGEEPSSASGFAWASDPADVIDMGNDSKDELCALVLTKPLAHRLLYMHNTVGF